MLQDLGLFVTAVIFVALNGLTMFAWAARQGYLMKPTAFALVFGGLANLLMGSITPISGQSSILTVSHFMKNVNERAAALLLAVIVMVPLGLFGGVTWISNFAGQAVVLAMMAGVGILILGITADMTKANTRTGLISVIAALVTWWLTMGHQHNLVIIIAVSVTVSTIDFALLQRKRVEISQASKDEGYTGIMEQSDSAKFWTKEFWAEFKMIKPKFNSLTAIKFALAFIALNIGTNIAFGNITANIGGTTQNMDHLTTINALADIPAVLFGGAPVGAIISGTANAPWPVLAGAVMMFLCAAILFTGAFSKAIRFIPVESISGFLLVIGFFSTFRPNMMNALAQGYPSQSLTTFAVTVVTKNPFYGLVAGVIIRYIGHHIGLG